MQWFETFFDALAHDVWRGLVPDAHSDAEAAFVVEELAAAGPCRSVLDVPSGDGRLAQRVARRGVRVCAVDLSTVAIERLSTDSGRPDGAPAVDARLGDMRWLDRVLAPDEVFDGAFTMGNSFGYLDDDGTALFLRGLAAHLRRGARLVIDAPIVAEAVLASSPHGHDHHEVGDVSLDIETTYDHRTSVLRGRMVLSSGGERDERMVYHRVLTAGAITAALDRAGFDVVAQYGGIDRVPFAWGRPLIVVAARHAYQ